MNQKDWLPFGCLRMSSKELLLNEKKWRALWFNVQRQRSDRAIVYPPTQCLGLMRLVQKKMAPEPRAEKRNSTFRWIDG